MRQATKEDIGKRIEFRAITRWNGAKATRKIRDIGNRGSAIVCFGGWKDFVVKPHEIISIS